MERTGMSRFQLPFLFSGHRAMAKVISRNSVTPLCRKACGAIR